MHDELKANFLNTLNSEDIIYDGNIISGYDLVLAINEELYDIWFLLQNKEYYQKLFQIPRCRMFQKTINYLGSKLAVFDVGYQRLFFKFEQGKINQYNYVSIYINEEGILVYGNNKHNDLLTEKFKEEFLRLNYDLIKHILKIMDSIKEKYHIDIVFGPNYRLFPVNNIVSLDKFYWLYLTTNDGECQIRLNDFKLDKIINDKACEESIFLRKILLIYNNDLLKKIPILINSLHPLYQLVIEKYYDQDSKQLVKK